MLRERMNAAIRIILIIFLVFSIIPCSFGERGVWDCPQCGRKGNTGNFCGACAYPAPLIDVPTVEPSIIISDESLPVGQMINAYGTTNAKVNFRIAPSTEADRKGILASGESVYIIRNEIGVDGATWAYINANGEEGYVKSEFIDMDPDDRNHYNQDQASPATAYTEIMEFAPESTADKTVEPEISLPSVPTLSDISSGSEAHLRELNDKEQRVPYYIGPGKTYVLAGGYLPAKQVKITAYYEENGWVLADVQYKTIEERMVYLSRNSFDSIGSIPAVNDLGYYEGTTTSNITPSWGPDNSFNSVKSLMIDKGTSVKIFFQENGFVYAEYKCSMGNVRMWLPANNIEIKGATVSYSKTPIQPAGSSSFK